jgi:hypothetical protein
MNMKSVHSLRLRPLAACVMLSCSLAAAAHTHAPNSTLDVTNCDDNGAGSLREAAVAAVSGDTLDLTALGCSTITLTSGSIDIAQDGLTLLGPGAGALAIDGNAQSGVLRHTGVGTLSISGLTITHGNHQSANTPLGGCLYSAGNIDLTDSTVSYCAAVGTSDALALGGAIYTRGDLAMLRTQVTDSHAQGMAYGAHGGGVYVQGNFTATDSTISRNLAYGAPIIGGQGGGAMIVGTTSLKGTTVSDNGSFNVGGLYTMGEVTIDLSTISGNSASHAAGMRAIYTTGAPTSTIINSTITGNHAFATVGGLNLIIPAKISNTTIAFNEAQNGFGGILMSGPTLQLDSTIIAGNLGFNNPDDFQVYGSPVITGANNLVVSSSATLPPDTLQDDPLLGVLGDYGGPTQTIPLMDGSPAIDTGNNVAQLETDQRGGGFPREVGTSADIGAFEVQSGSDVIFKDGFEVP